MDASAYAAAASAFVATCPCGSADLVPCDITLASSDHSEDVRATHECRKCGRRFRVVPPDREAWP